jgi:hypothetical protein
VERLPAVIVLKDPSTGFACVPLGVHLGEWNRGVTCQLLGVVG